MQLEKWIWCISDIDVEWLLASAFAAFLSKGGHAYLGSQVLPLKAQYLNELTMSTYDYWVTVQVVLSVLLTSKQMLHFSKRSIY